ncbi:hypothetical protein, partial [Streptomyces sp. NPDC005989]|uniref:hypothetical protein n=1 Tax=Streptomyces sp. NPDC005989 TaxID=3156727 RepID=UPI0033EF73E0
YDSSGVNNQVWPRKKDGVWDLSLQLVPMPGRPAAATPCCRDCQTRPPQWESGRGIRIDKQRPATTSSDEQEGR